MNGDKTTDNKIKMATNDDVQWSGDTATTLGGVGRRHDTAQIKAH